jgi:hypothetical protein
LIINLLKETRVLNRFRRHATLLCVVTTITHILAAAAIAAPSDQELLAEYRLSDENVEKWTQATRNLVQVFRDNPELAQSQDQVKADEASIADIAAWYDSKPKIKEAINSAGMTSREYTTFLFSMFQAGMGAYLAQQQGLDKLPKGTVRDNVEYYIINQKKLSALGKELQQLAPAE